VDGSFVTDTEVGESFGSTCNDFPPPYQLKTLEPSKRLQKNQKKGGHHENYAFDVAARAKPGCGKD
jgi:hypothetical protein